MAIDAAALAAEIGGMDGVVTIAKDGDWFFMYDPEGTGGHSFPVATIVTSNAHDDVSDLDRPGIYRVNVGVDRETFIALFGARFSELPPCDFAALDVVLPHPVYGPQYYVAVLKPEQTLPQLRELLRIAHGVAAKRTTHG